MPVAKTHYVGIPALAILQGLAWFTGHQQDIMTEVVTIMTAIFTAVSWFLSQVSAVKMIAGMKLPSSTS